MIVNGRIEVPRVLTIQSVMLMLLGFLLAALLTLLALPAYWKRAVRLTMARVHQTMPLTESEIRADKDRVRAEYAIKLHQLEIAGEKQAYAAARQQIELNRRDAVISALESEIGGMRTSLEEYENAHRVLEQTVRERVPSLEQRLSEARKLAFQRDRELAEARATIAEQTRTLEETTVAHVQQRDELMRLNSLLAEQAARGRDGKGSIGADVDAALRSEVEHLRARIKEQASELSRLRAAGPAAPPVAVSEAMADASLREEVERLRDLLSEAQDGLRAARGDVGAKQARQGEAQSELRAMRAEIEDQTAEIAKLKAALETYESGETSMSLKDSRLAMKARIGSLQAERVQQVAIIQRMRNELATANERLARQAQVFVNEMRRLGSKGVPAFSDAGTIATTATTSEARVPSIQGGSIAEDDEGTAGRGAALLRRVTQPDLAGMKGLLKVIGDAASAAKSKVTNGSDGEAGPDRFEERLERIAGEADPARETLQSEPEPEVAEEAAVAPRAKRLVERLSSATKS